MTTTPDPSDQPSNPTSVVVTSAPAEGNTVFSADFRREMSKQTFSRIEIGVTVVLDGLLLAISLIVRASLIWLIHQLSPISPGEPHEELRDWAVRLVEWVLNFGLVGTVLLVTAFDLTKRIRQGYQALRD